jgi:heme oxygenase (mycobilin-producing)
MFVAINYITCTEQYRERFETLFGTRAKAIDRMPGFRHMEVLRGKILPCTALSRHTR